MKQQLRTTPIRTLVAALAMTAASAPSLFGASQTWTNAPADSTFPNTNNWVARAVPGALNLTGNTVNNDIVTFNSPLAGGIGGLGNPILSDDATVTNFARARQIGGITFDTPNVGAYVIKAANPNVNVTDGNAVQTGVLYVSHNGSIQMTAGVTNSQTILGPLGVRLPSSTAGIYNFVNNSTNDATLYIETVTNYSANTRGTDFTLGGTNTGTNTIAHLSAGATTSGANGLLKTGPGTWILPNENDFRTQTAIRIIGGTLIARHAGVFSIANNLLVGATGTLQIDGVTLNQTTATLTNGGTIRMNGTSSLNGVAVGTAAGTSVTLTTTTANDVFTVGTGLIPASSLVSGGVADTVLRLTGPGTIALGTANTYNGNWSLEAVTNQVVNTGALSGRNVNIAAGATLDVSPLGGYFAVTSVSLGGSGTGTGVGSTAANINAGAGGTFDFGSKDINLSFAPTTFSGDTTHPSLYISQGSISLSGNFFTINNTSGTPLGAGTYRLIQQASGTVSVVGGPFAVVLGAGLQAGMIADIQVTGGNVNLVVSPHVAANLKWKGGNPDDVWDSLTTANFDNGVGFAQFGSGDSVTFDALGSGFPTVNIPGTVLPASVTVDTSATAYTFSGSGQIAGPTAVTKIGAGTLTLGTVNAYLGGTVISNGTIKLGVDQALPSAGSSTLTMVSPASIDMNGLTNKINGLTGNGSIDNLAPATASTLTLGNNNANGNFSGTINSSAGSVALIKIGTGTLTLSGSNSYSGGTTLSAGTLLVSNPRSLGTNGLTIDGGTLNLATNLFISSLAGAGGTIANNANTATNIITLTGSDATICAANIINGTGGVGLSLPAGTLTLSGNSTYTGGTYVGNGATFAIPNGPAAVGGFIIATNGATLSLSGGGATPGTPNSVTTLPGATVVFPSGAEGKIWQAQFNGSANSTNRYVGPQSFGQQTSFSNFLGVAIFANTNDANSNIRFFNGTGISGGDETVFIFERCNVHTRDSQTVRLGAIRGGSRIAGIGDQAGIVTWEIGGKNTAETFQGYINGVNNSLSKVGSGSLTLDGRMYVTNTVTLPDTSVVDYVVITNSAIAYLGNTTVSNGTLKIVAPNHLTNSPSINLAGTGAVLDVSTAGYFTNQTVLDINSVEQPTNSIIVTNGVLEILDGQSLNGHGTVMGSATTTPTSTMTIGAPIGTLNISGSISVNGTVNMDLNRSNPGQNSDRLTAASITGSGATLNVTNVGPTLITGSTYQLFGSAVTAFTTVNLPTTDVTGQIAYTWQNDLAVNGSITLLSGMSATPTPITSTISSGTNYLSWPVDHTGWTLQSQTNSLAVGLSTNWTVVAGSTTTNAVAVPVVLTNPATFYRLNLPLP
jgi:fibronectin-binding autotransporter adhesin